MILRSISPSFVRQLFQGYCNSPCLTREVLTMLYGHHAFSIWDSQYELRIELSPAKSELIPFCQWLSEGAKQSLQSILKAGSDIKKQWLYDHSDHIMQIMGKAYAKNILQWRQRTRFSETNNWECFPRVELVNLLSREERVWLFIQDETSARFFPFCEVSSLAAVSCHELSFVAPSSCKVQDEIPGFLGTLGTDVVPRNSIFLLRITQTIVHTVRLL